ncbi:MAG: DUF4065 domain-containing protein [Spiroplasma poulsonii]|nr:DUF4065 domain-containing protein [Spiroplasma sp. hyd1]MBW1242233.1 DUF4065 domain-containing protein [Spiroplasma poulsonii]
MFIQGLFMAKFQEKIIDEKFKAWKYGSVLEEMYYFLKEYGKSYVGKDNFKDFTTEKIAEIEKSFTKEQLKFIEKVFIYFNKYSALELVTISHVEGPWKETNYGEEISDDAILSYFHEKLKQIEQLI